MSDQLRGGTTIGGYLAWHKGNMQIVHGSSSFVGSGSEVTIAHGLGVIPSNVYAVATADTSGNLGDVWVRKDATNIYVGNSGTFTGTFDWFAIKL